MENISFLIKTKRCVGCGACVVACKNRAILKMDATGDSNIPLIDEKHCIHCGLCFRVCPVLNLKMAPVAESPLGEIKNIYLGHTKNQKIRSKASSGGIATALALFLLEKKYIEGALVTLQSENNPLENKTIIAKNEKEVLGAQGSKYAPTSPCVILKEVQKIKGRFLFVGKGCDIEGLKNLENVFPDLSGKTFLSVGLFCDHQPTRSATKELLNKNQINLAEVKRISYRGNGWPGEVSIFLKNGEVKKIPYEIAWPLVLGRPKFTLPYCKLCPKGLAELADISLGDPWALRASLEKMGESLIVTRSKKGEQVIQEMKKEGFIEIKNIGREILIASQRAIMHKKHKTTLALRVFKKIRKRTGAFGKSDWELIRFLFKLISAKEFLQKKIKAK